MYRPKSHPSIKQLCWYLEMSVSDCSLVNFPLERKPLTYITIVVLSNSGKILQRWKKNTVCAYLHYLCQKKGNVLHIIQTKLATLSKSEVQNSQRKSNNLILVCFDLKPCVSQKTCKPWNWVRKKCQNVIYWKKKKIHPHSVRPGNVRLAPQPSGT